MGRCPSCEEWGTLAEEPLPIAMPGARSAKLKSASGVSGGAKLLGEISLDESSERRTTGIPEFDRILGGGMVPGSVILIGGPPGIGKSTLVLQVAAAAAASEDIKGGVLYVSAEESPDQIAGRAARIGFSDAPVSIQSETETESILAALAPGRFGLVAVDSIQTIRLAALMGAAGTVGQVRECAARIIEWAKSSGSTVILIGHVTKEGQIAGPKVLEHLVDVVLYLDEDVGFDLRVMRSFKNRFGSSGEIALFEMTQTGMFAVPDGELPWLGQFNTASPSVFGVVNSFSRSWISEVQALVTPTAFQYPRRISVGFDGNRLAMLLAVIEKHLKMPMGTRDIHVNVVGGLKFNDTALDLPVVLAILGSYLDQTVGAATAAIGEIGLSGEIRRTAKLKRGVAEAARFGIKNIVVGGPEAGIEDGAKIVTSLSEAVRAVYEL